MSNTWTPAVYDRTATDVTNRTAKAFFNVADWLRIHNNARLANMLTNIYLGLSIPFTELTTPTVTSFPSVEEINTLVENIDLLRESAHLPAATGIVTLDHDYTAGLNGSSPDYLDVNDWERDLDLIRSCLRGAVEQVVHCGVGGCGQQRFWQVRFRVFPFVPVVPSPVRRPRCSVANCGTGLTRQNNFRRYN